jgi:glutaconate CoA-transferase subunit A
MNTPAHRTVTLEAAAALVQDGMTLALGGMTLYRRPIAFVRALLQRPNPPRDLTVFAFTAGLETDLLIGAGCVRALRTCYAGLEAFGLAPMFTERAGRGELHLIEETEASLAMGLRARTAGIGFMPARAWLGTDLPRLRPDVKTVTDPYTGETLMAFPAIAIDLAVVHGLAADLRGNVALNNNLGVDAELVYASAMTVATVEQQRDLLTRSADQFIIPAPGVHAIALAPRGAYPTSCYPEYPLGGAALMEYVEACSGGRFDAYLARFLAEA